MKITIKSTGETIKCPFKMEPGEVGEILPDSCRHQQYVGIVVLRIFDSLVSLNNPSNTWENLEQLDFKIKVFPQGTILELTV